LGFLAFVKLAEWTDDGEEWKVLIKEVEKLEGVYLVVFRWPFIYNHKAYKS
jgi:hypothetical protein